MYHLCSLRGTNLISFATQKWSLAAQYVVNYHLKLTVHTHTFTYIRAIIKNTQYSPSQFYLLQCPADKSGCAAIFCSNESQARDQRPLHCPGNSTQLNRWRRLVCIREQNMVLLSFRIQPEQTVPACTLIPTASSPVPFLHAVVLLVQFALDPILVVHSHASYFCRSSVQKLKTQGASSTGCIRYCFVVFCVVGFFVFVFLVAFMCSAK